MRFVFLFIVFVLTSVSAQAVVVLSEDFEGVPLGPPVQESSPLAEAWARSFPVGWTVDNSAMPTGPAQDEWWGWVTSDVSFWTNVAGDQGRSLFTLASGNVLVADGDELDDYFSLANNSYDSSITTPSFDVAGADFVVISFVSHYGPEGVQTGQVFIDFDNQPEEEILRYDVQSLGSFSQLNTSIPTINEQVSLQVAIPQGAATAQLRFRYANADNNWFWAIDNLVVDAKSPDNTPFPPAESGVPVAGLAGLCALAATAGFAGLRAARQR